LSDNERIKLATEAQSIAKELLLIGAPGKPGAKADQETAARTWKMCFDYELTKARYDDSTGRGGSAAAESEVLAAWGVRSRRLLFDALPKCRKHPQWKDWTEYETRVFRAAHPELAKDEVSGALSRSLRQST
jgi:hypothetical protein